MDKLRIRCRSCNKELEGVAGKSVCCGCSNMTTISTLLSDNYQEKAAVLGYVPLRGDILQKSRDAVDKISN